MTFDNEFEKMLNEYDIKVSDRTRRLIRRNSSKTGKTGHNNSAIAKVVSESAILNVAHMIWYMVRFILSMIFATILRIGKILLWICILFLKLAIEIWCVALIMHITRTAIRQYQLNLPL